MTDQALRRADELLSELVELVETARTVPMSSSCILPRERVLDLLDELRETMPPEMDQARRVIATRDAVLHGAEEEAAKAHERATAEADALVADARRRADELARDADAQARLIVEVGRAEHDKLVSNTGVRQAAAEMAASVRAEADHYAHTTRDDAGRYAAKLTGDAQEYADRTLAELAATLQRATATAEQGRAALARRRSEGGSGADSSATVGDPAGDGNNGAGSGISA